MDDTLLHQNVALIREGVELLRRLPAGAYAEAPADSALPAIGPHFRHCLDFYDCFLDGFELRIIDYGARARRPEVESRRELAIARLESAAERLERIDPASFGDPVELRQEPAPESERAPEPGDWLGSTVGRELQFLLSHTVHHYALIALALRLGGQPVPATFGVAPSTLEHWRREGRVVR